MLCICWMYTLASTTQGLVLIGTVVGLLMVWRIWITKNEDISKEEKANVIKQMLIIMHKGPQNGNIIYDDFNVGKRIGRLNGRTFYLDNIEFISQSPTGIYTKKYKL